MSKSILLLSSPRTGSSWIIEILARIPNTIRKKEIFNPYSNKEISSVFKSPSNYYKYFIEQLSLAKAQNQNLLYKIFLEHLDLQSIVDIVYKSDVIIFNYRTNILHQWISFKKAKMCDRWSNYNLTNYQIEWDEEIFLQFRESCQIIYKLAEMLIEKGYNVPFLNYEEIHQFNGTKEKIEFVNEKLKKVNICISNCREVNLTKQNLEYDYKKCFSNYDSFLEFKNTELFYLNKLN
jgi:hypothetical protein